MFKKPDKKEVFLHIGFCFLFLIVPIVISTRPPGEPFLTVTPPFIRDLVGSSLLLLFVYINYYWLIPELYFKKKYFFYATCILLSLAVICFLPALLTGRSVPGLSLGHGPGRFEAPGMGNRPFEDSAANFFLLEIRHHIYLFLIAVFFTILLRVQKKLAAIKEEKLSAALTSLKAQINPHFLFNTLNSIYALSVKKDEKAADAIINLSGLMRYVIKEANDNRIPLQKELEYLGNYICLQQARLGNTAQIHFEINGNAAGKEIVPLILITYIENAFKYGVNPDEEDCLVNIKIDINNGQLHLFVSNKKVRVSSTLESTGIGIENTRERLNLLYPDRHTLEVNESNNTYSVNLLLNLK